MREKGLCPSIGRCSEILEGSLSSSAAHPFEQKLFEQDFSLKENVIPEDCELKDPCFLAEDELVEFVKASESSRPFDAFGSFRLRHGDIPHEVCPGNQRRVGGWGMSSEAPAKLDSTVTGQEASSYRDNLGSNKQYSNENLELNKTLTEVQLPVDVGLDVSRISSFPVDVTKADIHVGEKGHRRVQRLRSFSTDIDREQAWERKRDLYSNEKISNRFRAVVRSVSDCGNIARSRCLGSSKPRTIARTLTDEDLEELRGCIDLGFGFSPDQTSNLMSTLPALELYNAINRQYADSKSRSPASPLDGVALDCTSSGGSPRSPLSDSWRISSPGDHPSQVKSRLRHWAQAVACSVKQGL